MIMVSMRRGTVRFLLLAAAIASPVRSRPNLDTPLPVETVAQLESIGWLENIAIRPNGDLLVTQLAPAPVLYTVRGPNAPNAKMESIYNWQEPNITVLLGITETTPDTFAVVAGNATANATGYPGTFSVWEVKFSSGSSTPAIRKLANISAARFLNGITTIPSKPHIILMADSQSGQLFRLDTRTGKFEIIASGPEFAPYPERRDAPVGFGVNGVKVWGEYLYFTNTDLASIFRVRITKDGHIAKHGNAPIELYADLSSVTTFVDDFAFAKDGTIWVVDNNKNTVVAVALGGKVVQIVAGQHDRLTIAGGTAGIFGRGRSDRNTLYISTSGALANPINGTVTEPGKVVRVLTNG